ncbi:MAG: conserved phage C-terminal domain-containing protein [Rhodocyclaceae bacterium]|nr:conserved phage C-terminal domain-containing protein [Rhodocyclaceae bacterium]MCA3116394.1 conserved phage C-terminal domain-containing protein [Rhodocyclaceae bacterium]MCA3127069.1 conserved phage C-terminal domain-containing protein [Rhodocyclaceae bacterium]
MPRIRSIKPEFWQDTRMAAQPALVRLVFVCLWSMADDEGRIEGDAASVWRFGSFREDSRDVANALASLISLRRVLAYEVDGNPYFQIVNWTKHQKVDKPSKSKFPSPPMGCEERPESSRILANPREGSGTDQGSGIRDQGSLETMSGKPDAAPAGKGTDRRRAELREQAAEVLAFLNKAVGARFQPVEANLRPIAARIGEFGVDTAKRVIVDRWGRWSTDEKMAEYLRPATLFAASNFANYAGQLPAIPQETDHA